ncbi:endonuclease domain-containing protein [Microbacterium tumbae]
MRHRIDLPASLGSSFSVGAAAAHGIGRRRAEARDLARPFHGVRARHAPDSFRALALAYQPRMRAGQAYGGRTAARLWGLPYPRRWSPGEDLVVVDTTTTPPHAKGIEGRRLDRTRIQEFRVGSLPVIDMVATLFMCAKDLTAGELVVMIDAVITTSPNYPGLIQGGRPMVPVDDIAERLAAWGRFRGCAAVREALPRARTRVESPKETETRLAIVGAELPEPFVQYQVFDGGRFIARVDLAYPELKIAIEYEGDGHRTDKAQWRRDIARQRELEALGWIVVRVTQMDLRDGARTLIAAVSAALASRR